MNDAAWWRTVAGVVGVGEAFDAPGVTIATTMRVASARATI
ncbi:hypothetical protein [Burkholderia sp. Bp8998]|nr:hypothetical protein [Burkholderia sp. Bp8998]